MANETPAAQANGSAPNLALQGVYLKDCSYEAPLGPRAEANWQPQINLDLATTSNPIQGDLREVVLTVTVSAKQNDKTLSITSVGRTRTYQLNGVEHREATSTRVGEIVMVSKAAWEGRTITITTATSYPNDMKTTEKETWSIDNQGQLVIDFVETAPGQAPRTMKITHKKKS